jgi:signal peptidase
VTGAAGTAVREGPTPGKPESKEHGLWHYLGLAVSGAMLVIVLGVAALAIVIPALVGGTALTVLTQSMEPKFPPGTLIIIRPTPIDQIKIGDVLTYQIKSNEPAVVSHRVISRSVDTKGRTTLITKGDNNDLPDASPVQKVQIKGTLWYSIPWLGYVNNLVGGQGRTLLIPLVAIALFVYAGYMVMSSVASSLKKKRTAADRVDEPVSATADAGD